jgi:hypothetical protein
MNKNLLILTLVLVILGISGVIIAEEFKEGIKLSEGKNLINLSSEFSPLYAEDLVKIYPDITTITYKVGDEEIGYVNVLGGVGENFVVYSHQIYEITVKREVILNLK